MPQNSAEWAQWVEAIGTLLAVITALSIALYQDKFRALIMRPKLEVSINLESPDCLKIPMTVSFPDERPAVVVDTYYFRLRVSNVGNQRAEAVEVFATSLMKRQADEGYKDVNTFLPMNLLWADYRTLFVPAISPGMYRHCDVGHILEPQKRVQVPLEHKEWPNVPLSRTVLSLDTAVKPNTRSYLLPPGKYRMTLLVAAANSKPMQKTLEISLTGEWYEDEQRMFEDGIGIQVL